MAGIPPIDQVVASLSRMWRRAGAVTDGFDLLGARAVDDAVEVAFHWRLDPQRYLVRFPYPALVQEILGDRFEAADAVGELALLLMEDLDTGFVGRTQRTPTQDGLLLTDAHRPHSGWFVSAVPLRFSPETSRRAARIAAEAGELHVVLASSGPTEAIADPGRFLDAGGFDGSVGRAAVAADSLVCWLRIDRGGLGDPRAGQIVVVAHAPRTARIAQLELRTDDPAAFDQLVRAACRSAVEAGFLTITASPELDELHAFGFHDEGGRLVAHHDELRVPADS